MTTLREAVTEHHDKILGIYSDIRNNVGVDVRTLSHQILWELEPHAFAEAAVVHPLLKEYLEGKGVEDDREEHEAIREALIRLQWIQPGTQDHAAALGKIVERFETHARSEEVEELADLEAVISRQVSQKAAKQFREIVNFNFRPSAEINDLADKLGKAVLSEEEEGGLGAVVGRN